MFKVVSVTEYLVNIFQTAS